MKLPVLPQNITLRKLLTEMPSSWELLTRREQQIADLLIKGQTHTQISKRLGITKSTVLKHVIAIKKKLGVKGPAADGIQKWDKRRLEDQDDQN